MLQVDVDRRPLRVLIETIEELLAKLYERRLNEGRIVITVDCGSQDKQVETARNVFKAHNVEDITILRPSGATVGERLNPPTPPPA